MAAAPAPVPRPRQRPPPPLPPPPPAETTSYSLHITAVVGLSPSPALLHDAIKALCPHAEHIEIQQCLPTDGDAGAGHDAEPDEQIVQQDSESDDAESVTQEAADVSLGPAGETATIFIDTPRVFAWAKAARYDIHFTDLIHAVEASPEDVTQDTRRLVSARFSCLAPGEKPWRVPYGYAHLPEDDMVIAVKRITSSQPIGSTRLVFVLGTTGENFLRGAAEAAALGWRCEILFFKAGHVKRPQPLHEAIVALQKSFPRLVTIRNLKTRLAAFRNCAPEKSVKDRKRISGGDAAVPVQLGAAPIAVGAGDGGVSAHPGGRTGGRQKGRAGGRQRGHAAVPAEAAVDVPESGAGGQRHTAHRRQDHHRGEQRRAAAAAVDAGAGAGAAVQRAPVHRIPTILDFSESETVSGPQVLALSECLFSWIRRNYFSGPDELLPVAQPPEYTMGSKKLRCTMLSSPDTLKKLDLFQGRRGPAIFDLNHTDIPQFPYVKFSFYRDSQPVGTKNVNLVAASARVES